MITDKENTFFERLIITADGVVGDVIRINNRQRNVDLDFYVQNEGTVNNATTIKLQVVSSAVAALTSPTVLLDTGDVAIATWNSTAGSRYRGGVPAIPAAHLYIGVIADVIGTAPTTGGFTGGIAETAVAETETRPTYYTGR